jgi:hypothetical protein
LAVLVGRVRGEELRGPPESCQGEGLGFESLQARRSDAPHDLRKQLPEAQFPDGEVGLLRLRNGSTISRRAGGASPGQRRRDYRAG